MKALFLSAEATPFIKTGGLADVAGTLPRALRAEGVKPVLMMPLYGQIDEKYKKRMKVLTEFTVELGWRKQPCVVRGLTKNYIRCYFIENNYYFNRDYIYGAGTDEAERYAFFCRAALESLKHLRIRPDLIHCNDWHTGMVPLLLKTQYLNHYKYKGVKTLFTIHNLRYQGVFDWANVHDLLNIGPEHFVPDGIEYYGGASFMKAGIAYSDAVNTVSPTYAVEIQTPAYGEGLDGLLRSRSIALSGIMNGIDMDEYNPSTDKELPAGYSAENQRGKQLNKAALQRKLGLYERPDIPLIGIVSRLTEQKGFSLIAQAAERIVDLNIQLAVLGKGEARFEALFRRMADLRPNMIAYLPEQNEGLARMVYGGADMFLMPSMYEPCGISQLIAMRYGTLPIVRETGGLKDSVEPYNAFTGEGTGFTFSHYSSDDMLGAIIRACECHADEAAWGRLISRAMTRDFSWGASAREYTDLYQRLFG